MTIRAHGKGIQQIWEHQLRASVDRSGGSPPVSGTKYEWTDGTNPLGTQPKVRIVGISARCDWTVQPTPLEVHVTLSSGRVITFTATDPISGGIYQAVLDSDLGGLLDAGAAYYPCVRAFLLEDPAVKVEFEITGGTVSVLRGYVEWEKLR